MLEILSRTFLLIDIKEPDVIRVEAYLDDRLVGSFLVLSLSDE